MEQTQQCMGVAWCNGYRLCLPFRRLGLKSCRRQLFLLLLARTIKSTWLRSIFWRDHLNRSPLNPLLSERTIKSSSLEANRVFLRIKKWRSFTTSRCFTTWTRTSRGRKRQIIVRELIQKTQQFNLGLLKSPLAHELKVSGLKDQLNHFIVETFHKILPLKLT